MSNCVFCKIVEGAAPSEIYYQDDDVLIFKDIKPSAKFHFLSIPKEHIPNVNSLTRDHLELRKASKISQFALFDFEFSVNKLITTSKEILVEKGGDVEDIRLGFHLPPFNSISHLHLHVISPASQMSTISRLIFKPHTWWFTSVIKCGSKNVLRNVLLQVEQVLEKFSNSKL
jgi:diadenosine tetraphosphate (Ap4A) HIT family hydrolase